MPITYGLGLDLIDPYTSDGVTGVRVTMRMGFK
jgi:hypothetical protein